MARRIIGLTTLLVAVAAFALPGAAAEESVTIGQTLQPAVTEIESGTTVTWRNRDDERHRMRSKDGPTRFDSRNLEPGESFSFTFDAPGEYPYYDHRNRDDRAWFGTIVVIEASSDAAVPTDSAEIAIIDEAFTTSRVAIVPGATVTWVNRGDDEHTVSADDLSFDSGAIFPGASFSMDFAAPGEYPYFCQIHPEMQATVVVIGPSDEPLAASQQEPTAAEPELAADDLATDSPSIGSALDLLATPPPE